MPTTIPQGRDGPASTGSGLCFHPSIKEIYPCKYLAFPWDYKRGARVHTEAQNTHTTLLHRATARTLSTPSRDLGLSPLSQPACTPYCKHLWVQGYTESTATVDVGHSWPEPV